MVINIKSKKRASSRAPGHVGSHGFLLTKLFLSALYLSAFTFGGGYVIVTLIKKKFINGCHWIDEQKMLDLVAITQSSPGAIAVNGAIAVGYKLTGMAGVLTVVTATTLPLFTILTLVSFYYTASRSSLFMGWMSNRMQAGVEAVIVQMVWEMGSGIVRDRQRISVLIMATAFITDYVYDINVILIILLCAAMGVVRALFSGHNKRGTEGGAL